MLVRIGSSFEIEIQFTSLYIKVAGFERFYNLEGLPVK